MHQNFLRNKSCISCHAVEYWVFVGQEIIWRVKLCNFALIQNNDSVVVHDGVESVGDGEHRAVWELPPDGGLHQVVSLKVHRSRRLVQN